MNIVFIINDIIIININYIINYIINAIINFTYNVIIINIISNKNQNIQVLSKNK